MPSEDKRTFTQEETISLLTETLNTLKNQQSQQPPPRQMPPQPGRPAPMAGGAAPLGSSPMGMEPIDIFQVLLALRRRIVFIILAALLGGLIMYGYTTQYVTPLYQASIQMIVNARPETVNATTQTTVGDINSAQSLVATYATVIKSNRVMEHVDKTLGLNMGWKTINSMVAVRPVDNTPVINIIVTCSDPELARKIVTTISEYAPEKIVEAVEAGSCRVISDADCPGYPISPNIRANVQKGLLIGAALCCAVVILLHILDDAIYSEDQLADLSPVPVLSVIPMANGKSSGKKYGYGSYYAYGSTGSKSGK